MSDETTPALAPSLTPYFGRDVTQVKIEIRKVGGGLQEALRFDPVEFEPDEEGWVALKVKVDSIRFDHIKDSDCLARVHIFRPVDDLVAFLDDDPKLVRSVEKHISGRAERIKKAREEQAGIMRLIEGDGGEPGEPFGHEPEGEQGGEPGDEQWENG